MRARGRLRAATRTVAQTALAVGLAWLIATEVFGYDLPFFAPVAAVITLGSVSGAPVRRAVEMAVGVALGILVGDLLILAIGTGPLQIVTVVALAMVVAASVSGSVLVVNQAAVSAILVATLQPPTATLVPHRVFHAIIGGGVAVLVGHLLLRPPPIPRVDRAARTVFDGLARAVAATAAALRSGRTADAEAALLSARALDARIRELEQTLADAHDLARLTHGRRAIREQLEVHERALRQIDLAVRNTRVLARAAISLLATTGDGPRTDPAIGELSHALDDLAAGVEALGEQLTGDGPPEHTRDAALRAASHAGRLFPDRHALALARVIGQVRATSVDLLRGSGLDLWDAQQLLDEQDLRPARPHPHDQDQPPRGG